MREIPLRGKYGNGKFAIIDDEDFGRVIQHKWFLSKKRETGHQYIRTRIGKEDVRLHRFIVNAPKRFFVDHINRDTLDNRKWNLRLCTNSENQMNSIKRKNKMDINGLSVPKGIKYDKSRPNKPWIGRVSVNGKRYSTKGYTTIEECLDEYKKLSRKYFGDFARISL